jgi:hypothetical protein
VPDADAGVWAGAGEDEVRARNGREGQKKCAQKQRRWRLIFIPISSLPFPSHHISSLPQGMVVVGVRVAVRAGAASVADEEGETEEDEGEEGGSTAVEEEVIIEEAVAVEVDEEGRARGEDNKCLCRAWGGWVRREKRDEGKEWKGR